MTRDLSGYGVSQSPYHVRTRTSLVDEYLASLQRGQDGSHAGSRENAASGSGEALSQALDRMDRQGWQLVAAAGEALLFRVRQG